METLRRCIHRQPPPSVGVVAYSRHRDPEEEEEEEEEEGEGGDGGAGPLVLLPPPPLRPRPRRKPRPQPRPCLHPLVTLALGSASAFLLGLLVAGIGRTPCGGGAWAGPDPGDVTLEEVVGGARPEAPPTWPQLREELQRRLRGERIEAWVREVAMEPHPPGSGRGQALAQAVLSAMVGAGLHRAWNRPQRVPLPTRGPPPSLVWVDAEGRELERLHLDPDAFCPWSPAGNVTGGLVYGHYGRPQDLELLRARGVTLGGHILLLRMGKGTPAAKVAAAEAVGAVGVLLYPDPKDVAGPGGTPGLGGDTAASVHVQDGAGDPYSRGFPSFTARAPPNRPPDLPHIPVQPLSASTAMRLLRQLGGPRAPWHWGTPGGLLSSGGVRRLRLNVGTGTTPGTLSSVFGVLEGRLEPDRYVIVGARRDSLGPGAAASGVGTALLMELAEVLGSMARDGFRLRRSLLFVSWDGAEFGHLGATEWLEGYPELLHTKAAAYISLDHAVLGDDRVVVHSSPLLHSVIESALRQVDSPNESGKSLFQHMAAHGTVGHSDMILPLSPESAAFPFTAAAGIPAVELRFDEAAVGWSHAALGTPEDTLERLQGGLRGRLPAVAHAVAAVAALLLLRLGHDARLPLDPTALGDALLRRMAPLQWAGPCTQWLYSARGDVVRAAGKLIREMEAAESGDERLNRQFNARSMAVEASLLSPFVSPLTTPFRHILLGRGGHTLPALAAELRGGGGGAMGQEKGVGGPGGVRQRMALLAWTLRGTAGALEGDTWDWGDGWERRGRGDGWDYGDSGDVGGDGGVGGGGDMGGYGDTWGYGDGWSYGDIWGQGDMGGYEDMGGIEGHWGH